MQLMNRVTRLEAIIGAEPEHCPGCGFPGTGIIAVLERRADDPPHPRCEQCNRPLKNGRPVRTPCKSIIREARS